MIYNLKFWITALVLAISMPVASQEYRFHGDSAVDLGAEDGGEFSFPPSDYSPYKRRVAPQRPPSTMERLPVEKWGQYPQQPYGGSQYPWGAGSGYLPGGGGALPGMYSQGGVSPLGFPPGGGFLLPW